MICRQPSLNKPRSGISPFTGCSLLAAAGWLFLMVATIAPAQAQDAVFTSKVLAPAHWTVSPIERKEDDGRMFCSSKAGYSTALSFVFARDSGGAQSLAFEFPDKMFSAGATVPILLAVGDVQYPLNALAATNRILLMGIARNSEIEQGLLQNNPVHLQFAQKQYMLSLAGFSTAVAQVDECLATLGKGEAFAPVKVDANSAREQFKTITPAVKRDITRVRNVTPQEIESFNPSVGAQNAVLQDEIRRLRRENQRLLIEKQAAESQLLAATVDTAAGGGDMSAVAVVDTMPSVPPYITRADKQLQWPSSKNFSDIVATYMTTEAARCPADFAQTPGAQYKQNDDMPVQEVETACLGIPKKAGDELPGDYAGALLFVGRKGRIDVVVHQGPAGMIEQALQSRSKTLRTLGIQKP